MSTLLLPIRVSITCFNCLGSFSLKFLKRSLVSSGIIIYIFNGMMIKLVDVKGVGGV